MLAPSKVRLFSYGNALFIQLGQYILTSNLSHIDVCSGTPPHQNSTFRVSQTCCILTCSWPYPLNHGSQPPGHKPDLVQYWDLECTGTLTRYQFVYRTASGTVSVKTYLCVKLIPLYAVMWRGMQCSLMFYIKSPFGLVALLPQR